MNTERLYQLFFSLGSAIVTALAPTLPYILLSTAAVLGDWYTAWQLDKRVRATYPEQTSDNTGKFNSRHFRSVLITLMQVYILLVFAHFTHIYITGNLPFNALKLAAGLVIGWQLWSCLENLSSCNGAKWAKVLQQVMVDKTARHFDIDLSLLTDLAKGGSKPEISQVKAETDPRTVMNNSRPITHTFFAPVASPTAAKPVIILGTAHGSNVAGKCSPDGKFREYRFSRDVIAVLRPMLEERGFTVFVDMPTDEVPMPQNTELTLRAKYVNAICDKFGKANCLYISIHVNAAGSDGKWHDARGFSVYVARNASAAAKRLAKTFCDLAMSRGLRGNRAIPAEHYWQANFYVLRATACPAVLTENLFQDNHADVDVLSSNDGKQTIARLHRDAILQYINQ